MNIDEQIAQAKTEAAQKLEALKQEKLAAKALEDLNLRKRAARVEKILELCHAWKRETIGNKLSDNIEAEIINVCQNDITPLPKPERKKATPLPEATA